MKRSSVHGPRSVRFPDEWCWDSADVWAAEVIAEWRDQTEREVERPR